MLGHPFGEIERAGATDIMGQKLRQLGVIGRILARLGIGLLQRQDQRHQRFGDETAAVDAEMPVLIGSHAQGIGVLIRRVDRHGLALGGGVLNFSALQAKRKTKQRASRRFAPL